MAGSIVGGVEVEEEGIKIAAVNRLHLQEVVPVPDEIKQFLLVLEIFYRIEDHIQVELGLREMVQVVNLLPEVALGGPVNKYYIAEVWDLLKKLDGPVIEQA